jgi:hypothetical protein
LQDYVSPSNTGTHDNRNTSDLRELKDTAQRLPQVWCTLIDQLHGTNRTINALEGECEVLFRDVCVLFALVLRGGEVEFVLLLFLLFASPRTSTNASSVPLVKGFSLFMRSRTDMSPSRLHSTADLSTDHSHAMNHAESKAMVRKDTLHFAKRLFSCAKDSKKTATVSIPVLYKDTSVFPETSASVDPRETTLSESHEIEIYGIIGNAPIVTDDTSNTVHRNAIQPKESDTIATENLHQEGTTAADTTLNTNSNNIEEHNKKPDVVNITEAPTCLDDNSKAPHQQTTSPYLTEADGHLAEVGALVSHLALSECSLRKMLVFLATVAMSHHERASVHLQYYHYHHQHQPHCRVTDYPGVVEQLEGLMTRIAKCFHTNPEVSPGTDHFPPKEAEGSHEVCLSFESVCYAIFPSVFSTPALSLSTAWEANPMYSKLQMVFGGDSTRSTSSDTTTTVAQCLRQLCVAQCLHDSFPGDPSVLRKHALHFFHSQLDTIRLTD